MLTYTFGNTSGCRASPSENERPPLTSLSTFWITSAMAGLSASWPRMARLRSRGKPAWARVRSSEVNTSRSLGWMRRVFQGHSTSRVRAEGRVAAPMRMGRSPISWSFMATVPSSADSMEPSTIFPSMVLAR